MDDMWLIISLDNGIVSSYCIDVTQYSFGNSCW